MHVVLTYVLWPPQCDPCDAWNMLQAQLGNLLPSPLLVAGVDSHGRPSGDLAGLDLAGLRFLIRIMVLDLHLLGLLLADFLDTGVGHFFFRDWLLWLHFWNRTVRRFGLSARLGSWRVWKSREEGGLYKFRWKVCQFTYISAPMLRFFFTKLQFMHNPHPSI